MKMRERIDRYACQITCMYVVRTIEIFIIHTCIKCREHTSFAEQTDFSMNRKNEFLIQPESKCSTFHAHSVCHQFTFFFSTQNHLRNVHDADFVFCHDGNGGDCDGDGDGDFLLLRE